MSKSMIGVDRSQRPIESTTTALFVCDMQNDFIHEDGAFVKRFGKVQPNPDDIVPSISKVLQAAREKGIKIIYTRVVNRPDGVGQSVRLSRKMGALMEGSWGIEIVDELKPRDDEFVVAKWRFSPFFGTSLETILRSFGVKTVVLSGVHTNGVIDSSARDAEYRDLDIVVLRDCCGAATTALHEAHLETIQASFGRVMTSGEFLEILRSD